MATKEYLISDGPILTEGGVLYRTQIVRSCFCCRRRTLTGRLSSSLTVYWREHWPRRLLSDAESERKRTMYVYYTFRLSQCFWWQGTFCRVSFFAESVFVDKATWFSAETYYIRIIKVSPILLSQFLLSLTRRIIADLDFVFTCLCMYV